MEAMTMFTEAEQEFHDRHGMSEAAFKQWHLFMEERDRGILHSQEWVERMDELKARHSAATRKHMEKLFASPESILKFSKRAEEYLNKP